MNKTHPVIAFAVIHESISHDIARNHAEAIACLKRIAEETARMLAHAEVDPSRLSESECRNLASRAEDAGRALTAVHAQREALHAIANVMPEQLLGGPVTIARAVEIAKSGQPG